MKPVKRVQSRTTVLATKDIDTDQIIAARFLTTTSRDGLGKNLFYDLRYDENGSEKTDFPLNQEESRGCQVLVAGNNFGCGSSREHAPWALLDYGFRAIISTEIADIFRNNALKNGLVPVVVDKATHQWLTDNPGAEVIVDVENAQLVLPNGNSCRFPIDGFAKYCLLEGVDQLGFLRQRLDQIENFEETRAWKP
ncbi:MAG: 3-isopropylmalate dehydratase small subunit [Gammaproteobacteria bacterium]|nr:3-isopropylmalate dehydratase small subunit [Gammaproteobacteria bacterium]MBU2677439.1 3-isopropylmalate dehydratase small subunit [Gammaproteobacteria bacterium]NNC56255.1 3-isopropylmalate dehydratase small subunit [Woeseiaceae bacterium]NNL51171.1 3-isopropylmalate dehydratase small subunit [Woeseiaceae bacterium]